MAVNGTCTNIHLPLPSIPETANQSINYTNSAYEPDRNGLAQILSTLLSRSTISTENVRAFFDKFVHKDINSWTVSEILRTNPVLSVVIYTSVALGLFLIFSIIFCILSCRNSYKTHEKRRKSSKINQISVCFLIIVFLIGIADMFYVAYRINKSKVSIDDTIQQFNREIYPKEISEHIIYLNKQLNQLDQYCTQRDSILINASKSILIETFDEILTTNYFISEILQSVNQTEGYVRELNFTIAQHTEFPPEVMNTFKQLQEGFDWMMDNIENPTEELCRYANDSQTEIDEKLVEALNVVHNELQKLNETIHNEILKEISPWNEHMLMSIKSEEDIREYFNIAGIVCMVLVLVLGGLPVVILVCVLISRLCGCYSDVSNEYDVNLSLDEMTPMPSTSKQNQQGHGRKVAPAQRIRKSVKSTPSCMPVCLMRIAFFLMMIILFILTLVTGVYYALDLSIQGSCRTIHNDQPYLINLLAEIYNGSIVIFDNQTQLNTTILDLLNDCQNHTHFTEKILANYWSILEKDMVEMMNTLNRQIFDQFISTIQDINIPEDMIILKNLTQQVNATDILKIVNNIEQEFSTVNEYFDKINASNASLPHDLVQTTINQFEGYLKQVLNSTIDACPLPISTISKTDTLFCHTLANSMNGLWLSLFIFMVLTTLGLSICGMNVYKRMSPIIITNRF